jgi:hypothetical protein
MSKPQPGYAQTLLVMSRLTPSHTDFGFGSSSTDREAGRSDECAAGPGRVSPGPWDALQRQEMLLQPMTLETSFGE